MIAAWMLYSLAVGALIAVAAVAAEQCCRLLRLPRRWVWVAAMCASVLLSGWALGQLRDTQATSAAASLQLSPSPAAVAGTGGAGRLLSMIAGKAGALRAGADALLARSYVAAASRTARITAAAVVLWGAATVVGLLLVLFILLRVARARRGWARHRIGDVQVLLSKDFGPAVVGVLRPDVVVPRWLLAEPVERQHVIVAHEEEHRRAHDPVALTAAFIGVCLLPWHLALWWLLARLRLAVELDCDDRILRRGVTPLSYGSLLLEIAARRPSRLFGVPALTDSRVHLERRLLAMTDTNHSPGQARPMLAGAAAVLLAAAACRTEVPTSADIRNLDANAAERQAVGYRLLPTPADGKAPLFFVDGKQLTAEEARAIVPDDIASIEVLKDAAAVREYGEAAKNGVIRVKRRVGVGELAAVEAPAIAADQEPQQARSKAAVEAKLAVEKKAGAQVEAKLAAEEKLRAQAGAQVQAKLAGERLAKEKEIVAKAEAKLAGERPAKEKEIVAKAEARQEAARVLVRRADEATEVRAAAAAEKAVRLRQQAEVAAVAPQARGERLPTPGVNPFIVIDGKASGSTQLPTLAPDQIQSVEVLKGDVAVKRFGERAAGGAIIITTRKSQEQ